jgi:hypothetical protein
MLDSMLEWPPCYRCTRTCVGDHCCVSGSTDTSGWITIVGPLVGDSTIPAVPSFSEERGPSGRWLLHCFPSLQDWIGIVILTWRPQQGHPRRPRAPLTVVSLTAAPRGPPVPPQPLGRGVPARLRR